MSCKECTQALQFPFSFSISPPEDKNVNPQPNSLFTQAFHSVPPRSQPHLAHNLHEAPPSDTQTHTETVAFSPFSGNPYTLSLNYSPISCTTIGLNGAIRGSLWGFGLGSVYGLSNTFSAYGLNIHTIQDALRMGLRTGAGFAAYSGVYSGTKCALVRMRGTNDVGNTIVAGAFTGASLSFLQVRGQWRIYNRHILSCTLSATGFAFVFDMLQRI